MAAKNTIVVFALDTKEKAHDLLKRLQAMDVSDENIEIKEAAFAHKVSKGRVELEQFNDLGGGRGAFGGGAIGVIAGTMVAGPLGAAVGGVVGSAVTGLYTKLRDTGVNNDFMKEVGNKLAEGKSALFIIYTGVLSQEMLSALREQNADLLHGELPAEAATIITETYEASGEELPQDIEVFTQDATEADTEPVDEVIAPIIEQAAQPAQEPAPTEPAEAAPDVSPAAAVLAAAAVSEESPEDTPAEPLVAAASVVVSKPAEPPAEMEIVEAEIVEVFSSPPIPQAATASEPAPDNLTVIDGIGPKVSKALAAAGITTYHRLARASEFELREAMLRSAMLPPKSLETWPRQALFAEEGNWSELYKFNARRKLALNQ